MLFVSILNAKPGSTRRSRSQRRLDWTYPPGMRVIGEYWLATEHPAVVFISEAETMEPIRETMSAWDDAFDIEVFPAVTADEGMALARRTLAAARA